MTTTTQSSPAADVTEEAIQSFADRVRAALRDLPEGDVVELTEGLEASLAEQAADSSPGSALPHDGDAVAYAAELRDAAGLPAAGAVSVEPQVKQPGLFEVASARFEAMRANILKRVRANATVSSIFDFFVALQPVWWVARGALVFLFIFVTFTAGVDYWAAFASPFWWGALAATIVISVQWGRGKWMPWRWLPPLRSLVSGLLFVIVLIAGPTVITRVVDSVFFPIYDTASSPMSADDAESIAEEARRALARSETGMWVNGQLASNLFAFDADGNLLQDVQLFDQDGRPVVTVMDPTKNSTADNVPSYVGDQLLLAPRPTNGGQYAWNVFPLRTLPADAVDRSNDPNGVVDFSKAKPTVPPKITVYPLAPLEAPAKADTKPTETTDPSKKPTP